MTTRNWSPDEHENIIDYENRQIASRNKATKIQNRLGVPYNETWSAEKEPILI